MTIKGPIDFIDWLHELPWYHISNLQFNYYETRNQLTGTYGNFLYTHYVNWCTRHGFDPSEEVDILGD